MPTHPAGQSAAWNARRHGPKPSPHGHSFGHRNGHLARTRRSVPQSASLASPKSLLSAAPPAHAVHLQPEQRGQRPIQAFGMCDYELIDITIVLYNYCVLNIAGSSRLFTTDKDFWTRRTKLAAKWAWISAPFGQVTQSHANHFFGCSLRQSRPLGGSWWSEDAQSFAEQLGIFGRWIGNGRQQCGKGRGWRSLPFAAADTTQIAARSGSGNGSRFSTGCPSTRSLSNAGRTRLPDSSGIQSRRGSFAFAR